jgi:hypothetical protein
MSPEYSPNLLISSAGEWIEDPVVSVSGVDVIIESNRKGKKRECGFLPALER